MRTKFADFENTCSCAITLGITPAMAKKIKKIANDRGMSRNQVIREAIVLYLGQIEKGNSHHVQRDQI